MNTPLPWPDSEGATRRVLEETSRVAAPSAADRERITRALRARLGAVALPEGFAPAARAVAGRSAARAGLGRGGWLSVVAATGAVAGAFGFLLGRDMAEPERAASTERVEAVAATSARASAPVESASAASEAQAETAGARPRALPAERAVPVRRRAVERTQRPAPAAQRGSPASEARGLSFADVLEGVQRANVALRQGQAALALIELAEFDRGAGEVLREERETTRVLALCAIGDTAGARRAAAPLLSSRASSIYAPRLEASCARADEGTQH